MPENDRKPLIPLNLASLGTQWTDTDSGRTPNGLLNDYKPIPTRLSVYTNTVVELVNNSNGITGLEVFNNIKKYAHSNGMKAPQLDTVHALLRSLCKREIITRAKVGSMEKFVYLKRNVQ